MKFFIYLLLTFIIQKSYSQQINLIRLNECENSDLDDIKKYIDIELGTDCKITRYKFLYNENESVICDSIHKKIYNTIYFEYNKKEPINIYITKSPLLSRGNKVCGVSYGNNIYITTRKKYRIKCILTHELAHTFGAEHCQNMCIMNITYNPTSLDLIWDSVKNKPKFCSECQKYWKDI